MLPSMELENKATPDNARNGVRASMFGIGHILERESPPYRNRVRLHPEKEDPAEDCQESELVLERRSRH